MANYQNEDEEGIGMTTKHVMPSGVETSSSAVMSTNAHPTTVTEGIHQRRNTKMDIATKKGNKQGHDNAAYDDSSERSDIGSASEISKSCSKSDRNHGYWGDGADILSVADLTTSEAEGTGSACSLDRYKGIALTLISTIIVSFGTVFVALLTGSIGSNEVFFAQMIVQLLLCIPLGVLDKITFKIGWTPFLIVLYRCVIGSTASLLAYFAFQVMPIGNAKAIIYSSPVFTGLFSCILLREACGPVDIVLSAVTLSGVLLVIQPTFIFGGVETSSTILGPIFCLLVAIIVGTIYIALRKIGQYVVNPIMLLTVYSLIGIVFSTVATTITDEWTIPRCGWDRITLIAIGVFFFLGQIAMTISLRYEKATVVSLIRTSDVLFTFVLEYLFFGVVPNYITVIGAILIVGSLVGITLNKWRLEKKKLGGNEEDELNTKEEIPNTHGAMD